MSTTHIHYSSGRSPHWFSGITLLVATHDRCSIRRWPPFKVLLLTLQWLCVPFMCTMVRSSNRALALPSAKAVKVASPGATASSSTCNTAQAGEEVVQGHMQSLIHNDVVIVQDHVQALLQASFRGAGVANPHVGRRRMQGTKTKGRWVYPGKRMHAAAGCQTWSEAAAKLSSVAEFSSCL